MSRLNGTQAKLLSEKLSNFIRPLAGPLNIILLVVHTDGLGGCDANGCLDSIVDPSDPNNFMNRPGVALSVKKEGDGEGGSGESDGETAEEEAVEGLNTGPSEVPKGTKPRTNKLGPDPKAEGPHTQFKRDPKTGKVTGYTEFDGAGNPVKRFRGEGKPHGGTEPPFILEPKAGKGPGSPPKVPRTPRPDELPKGY